MPIQTFRFGPFTPLTKLAAHEQKLLAGMRPHVAVKRAQVRELLPLVAGHLVYQRGFHMNNLDVGKGKDEVLAPRVEQTKRQGVVITATKQRIGLKILQRLM